MKRINALIFISIAIVTVCMVLLVFRGVSLRSAPLIQPSVMDGDLRNVAVSTVQRLHQEFEDAQYTVFGILPMDDENGRVLRMMTEEYERVYGHTVRLLEDNETLTSELLAACDRPCWILTDKEQAHSLDGETRVMKLLAGLPGSRMSLSFVSFTGNEEVSASCHEQQRLTFECLAPVAVREVRRRMKDPQKRYFFLRKYQEADFFLFLKR